MSFLVFLPFQGVVIDGCIYPRRCRWAMDLLGFQPVFIILFFRQNDRMTNSFSLHTPRYTFGITRQKNDRPSVFYVE